MPPRGAPQPHPYAQPGVAGQSGIHSQPAQQVPFVHTAYGQPNSLDPYDQAPYPQANQYGMPNPQAPFPVNDPLMAMGSSMLRQSGANYLESGKRYMQSWTGVLSGGLLHYHFDVNSEYVRNKFLMLLAPYLRRWNYTRVLEQITGGHKYLPPRQDVSAPDLYIPFMAVCTCCLLASISKVMTGRFSPDTMYATVSTGFGAWAVHWVVLKALMYVLGASGAIPFLELASYAGYPFVPACIAMVARMTLGTWGFRTVWAYGAAMIGIVLVRTLKRIIFYEARQYSIDSTRHNYLLLALWIFEFPFTWWLALLP